MIYPCSRRKGVFAYIYIYIKCLCFLCTQEQTRWVGRRHIWCGLFCWLFNLYSYYWRLRPAPPQRRLLDWRWPPPEGSLLMAVCRQHSVPCRVNTIIMALPKISARDIFFDGCSINLDRYICLMFHSSLFLMLFVFVICCSIN